MSPVASLREKLDVIRQGEVAKALARLPHASPEARAAIEAFSDALVHTILETATEKLRDSSRGADRRWVPLLLELFGLTAAGVATGLAEPGVPPAARVATSRPAG